MDSSVGTPTSRGYLRSVAAMLNELPPSPSREALAERLIEKYFPPTRNLRDGTIGYSISRRDDCLRAAVATCLQVPPKRVPDPRIDERYARGCTCDRINDLVWGGLREWLAERGLRFRLHDSPPWELARWIGIVPKDGFAQDHCLVMERDVILFDPAFIVGVTCSYCPTEIETGLSFEPV